MRRARVLTVIALATLAAGCGEGETVTEVRTVTAPPASSGATSPTGVTGPTAATGASGAPAATGAPADPLPDGRAAVDGRYLMKVRATASEGRSLLTQGTDEGEESTWPISTVCTGSTCRLKVRRELESGAFESLTLDEVKDRTYAAASTGKTTKCALQSEEVDTKQRLSVRATAVKDINGRPTAQRIDAYMTIRATCSSAVDEGLNRATISWRGTRLP
jgi:ferredoxin